jgi:enoyl-CoA hydratase/carnithine racemase
MAGYVVMSSFETIDISRVGDVTLVRFHTGGGPLRWSATVHREAPTAFAEIASDSAAKAVVVTGTGDVFCVEHAEPGFANSKRHDLWREGRRMIAALLDIEVPVIGVLNGPASIHAEIPMIADIVLAADDATISDDVHFVRNTLPGDGAHLIWPWLLGPRRGKYFLLTGHGLSAYDCLNMGVVNEVLPRGALLVRAIELAQDIASRPIELLRYTRELLNLAEREKLRSDLAYGLALESFLKLEPPLADG